MARKILDLENKNPETTQNPDGSLKDDVITNGVVTEYGSEILASFVQDLLNVYHRTGRLFGKFLNGSADTQLTSQFFDWFKTAIRSLGGNYYGYAVSTSANNYQLNLAAPAIKTLGRATVPVTYVVGQVVRFLPITPNTSETVTLDLYGLGYLPVRDNGYAVAGIPIGAFASDSMITCVLSQDSVGGALYWRLVQTPLNSLTDGTLSLETVTTTLTTALTLSRTLFKMVKEVRDSEGADTDTYTSQINENGASVVREYLNEDKPYWKGLFLDIINGIVSAQRRNADLSGTYFQTNVGWNGLNAVGGPNPDSTNNMWLRHCVVSVPDSVLEFRRAVDSRSQYCWKAFVYGTTTNEAYFLPTAIPIECMIHSIFAVYTDINGKQRFAPVVAEDSSSTIPTNSLNISINDTNVNDERQPLPNGTGKFMYLLIWYNATNLIDYDG